MGFPFRLWFPQKIPDKLSFGTTLQPAGVGIGGWVAAPFQTAFLHLRMAGPFVHLENHSPPLTLPSDGPCRCSVVLYPLSVLPPHPPPLFAITTRWLSSRCPEMCACSRQSGRRLKVGVFRKSGETINLQYARERFLNRLPPMCSLRVIASLNNASIPRLILAFLKDFILTHTDPVPLAGECWSHCWVDGLV